MSNVESQSQLSPQERQSLADKIRTARHEDRHSTVVEGIGYQTDRGLIEYYDSLGKHNVDTFLKYLDFIKKEDAVVLDLGTGVGNAAKELREKSGLKVVGTSLTWSKKLEGNLGKGNFRITSAEKLKGIENVDGVLAANSLYYVDPEKSASRIDEVLNSGGVVMANFSSKVEDNDFIDSPEIGTRLNKYFPNGFPMGKHLSNYSEFQVQFEKLGYYVDVFEGNEMAIFAAIKPGGLDFEFAGVDFFYRPGGRCWMYPGDKT